MGDEVQALRAELDRLTEGSAWRKRIMEWLMEAVADDKMKELVDEQTRRRMVDLCRTEDRYIEVIEALEQAGLKVKGGELIDVSGDAERSLSEVLQAARQDSLHS